MLEALPILGTNLLVSSAFFLVLWLLSIRLQDPSFIDSWWGLGVLVLVWTTWVQLPGPTTHGLAVALLATAWGLRLGLFLLARWRGHGIDRRYAKMIERARETRGWSFATTSLLFVFLPQMLLQIVMALPAQLGQLGEARAFGALAMFGATLATFGIIYEAIADAQLSAFKANAANKGKVMDRGLWRYSRHPNYFGELCAWWGMFCIALETPLGLWSLPGPLLITFLLTRVSGAPTTEPHLRKTRPDYEAYRARTSSFIPMPPRG
jgi:steroid 5-alpha reductase family enzyme